MEYIPANSNNFEVGRRGNKISLIIIHSVVGSIDSCIRTFQDPSRIASAHYIVGWDGRTVQMVKDEDTAYHAGNFAVNMESIGIEHDDQAKPLIVRPDALYEASARLVAELCKKHNLKCDRTVIRKHSEVSLRATACPAGLDIERIVRRAQELLSTPPAPSPTEIIGVITAGPAVNVRNSPQIADNIIQILEQNRSFVIEGQTQGQAVLNNNIWYKIKGISGFIWSGRVDVIAPEEQEEEEEEPISVTLNQARAAQVLTEALPNLRTKDGQLFGNEEGLARELVAEWVRYKEVIVENQKQKSLIDKIVSLLGFS